MCLLIQLLHDHNVLHCLIKFHNFKHVCKVLQVYTNQGRETTRAIHCVGELLYKDYFSRLLSL